MVLAQSSQWDLVAQKVLKEARATQDPRLTNQGEQIVRAQFRAETPRLNALTQQNNSDESNLLVSFALGEYLAELRDNKYRQRPPGPGREPVTIEDLDLMRNPFSEFLRRQYPSEAVPKGYLKVESLPAGAEIRIDNTDKGWTDKPFVIRPGRHDVSVISVANNLRCQDSISVERDKTVVYHCPRK